MRKKPKGGKGSNQWAVKGQPKQRDRRRQRKDLLASHLPETRERGAGGSYRTGIADDLASTESRWEPKFSSAEDVFSGLRGSLKGRPKEVMALTSAEQASGITFDCSCGEWTMGFKEDSCSHCGTPRPQSQIEEHRQCESADDALRLLSRGATDDAWSSIHQLALEAGVFEECSCGFAMGPTDGSCDDCGSPRSVSSG